MHQTLSHWSVSVFLTLAILLVSAFGPIVHFSIFAAEDFTLVVSVDPLGSGSVNLNNTGPYFYGDVIRLTAVPAAGWSFDYWSGDLLGSVNPASLTVTGNMSVIAHFTQNTYTLETSVTGQGSLNLNNTGPYFYGDVIRLTAVPAAGWSFSRWSRDLLGSDNPATLTVTGNMIVAAHFQKLGQPTLNMDPETKTCSKLNQTFTVQVTITSAINVEGFRFGIRYNATLLDFVSITWNAWGSGVWVADEANGNLTGQTSGSAISGDFALMTITFNASYHHLWKDENTVSGWENLQNGAIYLQNASLSRSTGGDLKYVRGGISQINVGPDFAYTFSPIQGDIDNNGIVDLFDLRAVSAIYDSYNLEYNLVGYGTIDIFDLVVIAANFNFT